jgi:hypothetical protein
MSDTPTDPKPGYKTTEFWLAALASLVGLLFAADIFPAESQGEKFLGLAAMVLSSLGYTVSRTMVKK